MNTITGNIEGITPILFNRMTDASLASLDSGTSGGPPVGVEARIEEAKTRCYRDAEGLYLPAWTFKRMLLDGCVGTKLKLSKAPLKNVVYATVFVSERLGFNKMEPDFIHECVGKIPPRTGKAAIIRRPALERGWTLRFALTVTQAIPDQLLRQALEFAGLRIGLGSWRPEFGRFLVKEWLPAERSQT